MGNNVPTLNSFKMPVKSEVHAVKLLWPLNQKEKFAARVAFNGHN